MIRRRIVEYPQFSGVRSLGFSFLVTLRITQLRLFSLTALPSAELRGYNFAEFACKLLSSPPQQELLRNSEPCQMDTGGIKPG
jgi:hypothetical protein